MAMNGSAVVSEDSAIQEAFSKLSELEKDFAAVELDALRQKEFSSRELYAKRSTLTSAIPSFWSEIFTSGAVPAEIGAVLTPIDGEILGLIESLNVERYQIKSDTEGEPRSLRFTFKFLENDFFTDKTVVKDFEYKAFGGGPGGYVSKPVNFKWTKRAQKTKINTLLDLAEQLYQAEEALVQNGGIEQKEREGLWQYEKLREELEKEAEGDGRSFLDWFGYRGAVNTKTNSQPANGNTQEDVGDESESEDEDDAILDVEIFDSGDDVAIAIAEDLWPNVMDYFIQATSEDTEGDSDENDDAPELVETADFEGFQEEPEEEPEADPRPAKKRKTTS